MGKEARARKFVILELGNSQDNAKSSKEGAWMMPI